MAQIFLISYLELGIEMSDNITFFNGNGPSTNNEKLSQAQDAAMQQGVAGRTQDVAATQELPKIGKGLGVFKSKPNSFSSNDDLIALGKLKAEDIVPAMEAELKLAEATINKILSSLNHTPSFEDTIIPLLEIDNKIESKIFAPAEAFYVANVDGEFAAAIEAAQKLKLNFDINKFYTKDVFKIINQVNPSSNSEISVESQEYIIKNLKDQFELKGIGLSDENRAIFATKQEELMKLPGYFLNNLKFPEIENFEIPLDIAEDFPAELKQILKQEGDKYIVTINSEPDLLLLLKNLDDADLRKNIYISYMSRFADVKKNVLELDNMALMDKALGIRADIAKLFAPDTTPESQANYDFVDLALKANRSFKNKQEVLDYLNRLHQGLMPKAIEIYSEIKEFSKQEELHYWDLPFYLEKYISEHFYQEKELKPYMELNQTIQDMFKIAEEQLGIKIKKVEDEKLLKLRLRDDDDLYQIIDSQGKSRGFFEMDLYSRPGAKKEGAWLAPTGRRNDKKVPYGILTLNINKSEADKPTFLEFTERETLFHEFGHTLHNLLASSKVAALGGILSMPIDFIEVPSQFWENMAMKPEAFTHYETQNTIDSEVAIASNSKLKGVLPKIKEADRIKKIFDVIQVIQRSMLDLRFHMKGDPANQKPVRKIYKEVNDQYGIPGMTANLDSKEQEYGLFLRHPSQFSHLMKPEFPGMYTGAYNAYLTGLGTCADLNECEGAMKIYSLAGDKDPTKTVNQIAGKGVDAGLSPEALIKELTRA